MVIYGMETTRDISVLSIHRDAEYRIAALIIRRNFLPRTRPPTPTQRPPTLSRFLTAVNDAGGTQVSRDYFVILQTATRYTARNFKR